MIRRQRGEYVTKILKDVTILHTTGSGEKIWLI
jgi:hypothetical protein